MVNITTDHTSLLEDDKDNMAPQTTSPFESIVPATFPIYVFKKIYMNLCCPLIFIMSVILNLFLTKYVNTLLDCYLY